MHTGSWMLQFRVEGKQRKLWLGRMPAMGLRQARQAARKVLTEIAEGKELRHGE
jgi:hypothetical protein